MRPSCKKIIETAYHLPDPPIPNDQFLVLFYNSGAEELNPKRDPGAADLLGGHNLTTAAQVQWKDFLDGHLVR